MIFHENCLLADNSHERSYLFFSKLMKDVTKFVALRPKSTAMVMVGRSVHLTTLFPVQA